MKEYIHYGHTEFNLDEVQKSVPSIKSKPDKGIWASPVDTDWGWKDWCESEDWSCSDMSVSFRFILTDSAKILEVHKEEDILDYVITNQDSLQFRRYTHNLTDICDYLDTEKLYSEFDGIELFLSDNYSMHDGIFNSWDCDSIVVWNPDVIIPIRED